MRRMYPLLAAALLALILAGCGAKSSDSGTTDVPFAVSEPTNTSSPLIEPTVTTGGEGTPTPDIATSETTKDPQANLQKIGQEVVEILRDRDLKSLSAWIDPEQGVRFSPYTFINKDSDLVFKADTIPAFDDTTKYTWGTEDGSGAPIELSFRDYFEKFVYNQDFADATNVSVNKILGTGNTKFNADEIYPDASYVEFHFPGFDKKAMGMDWQSLVLVFLPSSDENWKLAAIVHGQWTI